MNWSYVLVSLGLMGLLGLMGFVAMWGLDRWARSVMMERLEATGPRPRWVPVSDVEKLEAQCKRLCATVKLYEERHVQLQQEHAAEMKQACGLLRRVLEASGEVDIVTLQEAQAFLSQHGWEED